MTFSLHIEHEIIDGETVLEQFSGVESFNDPPMTEKVHISFADDRDDKRLSYGNVVRATVDND